VSALCVGKSWFFRFVHALESIPSTTMPDSIIFFIWVFLIDDADYKVACSNNCKNATLILFVDS
jgi:hypothetical protein